MRLIPESPWKRRRRERVEAVYQAQMDIILASCYIAMDLIERHADEVPASDPSMVSVRESLRRCLRSYLAACECTETTPEPFWIERFPEMTAKVIRAF